MEPEVDDKLIETAVSAMVGALAKSAAEPVVAAGKSAWHWLRGKLSPAEAHTAQAIEAAPEKASARSKLTGLLQDTLENDVKAEAELRALLGGDAGLHAINQSLVVTGNNNKTAQLAGDQNKLQIS